MWAAPNEELHEGENQFGLFVVRNDVRRSLMKLQTQLHRWS
jgi:hypothetical protein